MFGFNSYFVISTNCFPLFQSSVASNRCFNASHWSIWKMSRYTVWKLVLVQVVIISHGNANCSIELRFLQRKKTNGPKCQHLSFNPIEVEISEFSANQILRKIIFGHFEGAKAAILTVLAALDISFLGISDIFKCDILKKQNSYPP